MWGDGMNGRLIFSKIKPLLKVVNGINLILPEILFRCTWWLVCGMPGKLGFGLRYLYFKRLCKHCGDVPQIGPNVTILGWKRLWIGDRVSIHSNCYIDARGSITIQSDTSIAHQTSVLSFEHTYSDPTTPIKYNPLKFQSVSIGCDVWIGCGVRILAGSDICDRTIIAAGAVVPRGSYHSGIYAGVPAKLKSELNR